MIDISVVIVSWNAKSYLEGCLRSLQHRGQFFVKEVFVVDNASSDGSPQMVEQDFPSVRLIRNQENVGFARANNQALKLATGQYVALVNSDVVVRSGCLERLTAYLDEHPKVGMAGPHITGGDGFLQRSCRGFPSLWNMLCRALALDTLFPSAAAFNGYEMRHWKHDLTRQVDVLSGCFWLARRTALDQVGLLDEEFFFYGEDIDWCRRFRDRGWPLVFVAEADAVHFGGASSSRAPVKFYVEMQCADSHYWQKHHALMSRFLFRCIMITHHAWRLVAHGALALCFPRTQLEQRHKFKRCWHALCWLVFGVTCTKADGARKE